MSKYRNSEIFKVIELYDKEAGNFANALNYAVCVADDIMDHKEHTNTMITLCAAMVTCMGIIAKRPDLFEAINKRLGELINGQAMDLEFLPKSKTNEDELQIWKKRGEIIRLMFDLLCHVDKTFETPENREWIENYTLECGKYNDAKDILEGKFEDFIQCRRNFVALTCFDQDIYFTWRHRKDDLIKAAKQVMDEIKFPEPVDKRLKMAGG